MEAVEVRKSLATVCCVCWRQKGENGWQETAGEWVAGLSHGYCPDCYRRLMSGYGLVPISEQLPAEKNRCWTGQS